MIDGLSVLGCRQRLRANAMRAEDADAGRSRNSTREHELSISALAEAGIAQIMIDSSAVRDAASFYRGRIMGGILRAETDALFRNRRRV